jgi:hypothetical protein
MDAKLTWHNREVKRDIIHYNDDNTVEIVMADTGAQLDIDRADLIIVKASDVQAVAVGEGAR